MHAVCFNYSMKYTHSIIMHRLIVVHVHGVLFFLYKLGESLEVKDDKNNIISEDLCIPQCHARTFSHSRSLMFMTLVCSKLTYKMKI